MKTLLLVKTGTRRKPVEPLPAWEECKTLTAPSGGGRGPSSASWKVSSKRPSVKVPGGPKTGSGDLEEVL
jgi:hypothetical protein